MDTFSSNELQMFQLMLIELFYQPRMFIGVPGIRTGCDDKLFPLFLGF